MNRITLTLLLVGLGLSFSAWASDEERYRLQKQGTQRLLEGDFATAKQFETRLIREFDDPVGHIFALNTVVTHLTWNEATTDYDDALQRHATSVLDWCQPILDKEKQHVLANFYCGQANFSLAYFHGLRGNYYQAGKHGTRSIQYLESAITEDPSLIDAKMHLGVAYFIADNLPPFIRMFSRFLWFIPTGNSEKSIPYLQDVIDEGDLYHDVARYIYSVLLLEDPERKEQAEIQLERLVAMYPSNARFQLRLISVYLSQDNFTSTLETARTYIEQDPAPVEPDLSLAKVWMARAYLGLNQTDNAAQLFAETEAVFESGKTQLPDWSVAWHMLTTGQLHDLANRRAMARDAYTAILRFAKDSYVSKSIEDAARAGLESPYRL